MNKSKINLMIVTHDLAIGGLQQVVVSLCRSIDRDIFNISVLCLRRLGEYKSEIEDLGIKVLLLPQKKKGTDYFSFIKVATILRDEKIEVIHTHNTQPFVDGTIASLLSGLKVKIIHTDHARYFPDKFRYMFAEHVMSYFAYKVVGVSKHTSDNLIKYEKISKNKIVTIENGVDNEKYEKIVNKAEKKQELGIYDNGPVLGVCARLTIEKGIEYLIKAMPNILTVYPNAKLLIAGDGALKEELERLSISCQVSDHILFLGSRLDIPELLKIFDIYILPSISEGLPMIILEAMAAGCPIVATEVGGVPKAIVDGENGLLVRPGDPEQLFKSIKKLSDDEKLQEQFISRSKEIFKKQFSAKNMARQYEALYLKSLGIG